MVEWSRLLVANLASLARRPKHVAMFMKGFAQHLPAGPAAAWYMNTAG